MHVACIAKNEIIQKSFSLQNFPHAVEALYTISTVMVADNFAKEPADNSNNDEGMIINYTTTYKCTVLQ